MTKARINFILFFVFVFLLCFISGFFFPWWAIAIVPFLLNIPFKQKPLSAFLSSFLAVFLLWGSLSVYLNSLNENILSQVVCKMFFNIYVPYLVNVLTALLGGLVGGLGGLVGSHFVALIKNNDVPKPRYPIISERKVSPLMNPITPRPQTPVPTIKPAEIINPIAPIKPPEIKPIAPIKPAEIKPILRPTTVVELQSKPLVTPIKQEEKKGFPEKIILEERKIITKPSASILQIHANAAREKSTSTVFNNDKKNEIKTTLDEINKKSSAPKSPSKQSSKAIPKSSAPFKIPSIKEQTEKKLQQLKKLGKPTKR